MILIRSSSSFGLLLNPSRFSNAVVKTPFSSSSLFLTKRSDKLPSSSIITLQAISSTTSPSSTTESSETEKSRKWTRRNSKQKRKEFIGMAKAIDRGQHLRVYDPGGEDGMTFVAKSGLPDRSKVFTVLGIESSCDDTGAAVIRSDGQILGECLSSQTTIHEEFGGIVPNLAKTAHEQQIDSVVDTAIRRSNLTSVADVDAIGVTVGPGLEVCLRVGCEKAKKLALEFGKPFVGVHHLEAHVLMARLPFGDDVSSKEERREGVHSVAMVEFPFLALLVSGGHCQLMKCFGIGKYSIMGGTLDDSLGEAFDKTARLLGLPVGGGGGPAVEKLAKGGTPRSIPLPVPLQKRKHDFDFSYAGLKTAVRMASEKLARERGLDEVLDLDQKDKSDIAASFQDVAFRHIEERLDRAMKRLENEGFFGPQKPSLVVVGGVAANSELRSRLRNLCMEREHPWRMFVPPPRLCTDQGTMSAWAAVERLMVGSSDEAEEHEVYARFPFRSYEQQQPN